MTAPNPPRPARADEPLPQHHPAQAEVAVAAGLDRPAGAGLGHPPRIGPEPPAQSDQVAGAFGQQPFGRPRREHLPGNDDRDRRALLELPAVLREIVGSDGKWLSIN